MIHRPPPESRENRRGRSSCLEPVSDILNSIPFQRSPTCDDRAANGTQTVTFPTDYGPDTASDSPGSSGSHRSSGRACEKSGSVSVEDRNQRVPKSPWSSNGCKSPRPPSDDTSLVVRRSPFPTRGEGATGTTAGDTSAEPTIRHASRCSRRTCRRTPCSRTSWNTSSGASESSMPAQGSPGRDTPTPGTTGLPSGAASHERAAIERVLRNTIGRHDPPARDRPEGILDRRTVYRWLPTTEQLEWVGSVLLTIARHLPRERAIAIRGWIENTVDNDAPTP